LIYNFAYGAYAFVSLIAFLSSFYSLKIIIFHTPLLKYLMPIL